MAFFGCDRFGSWACILHGPPPQPFKVNPLTQVLPGSSSGSAALTMESKSFLLVTGFGGNAFYCFRAGRNNLYWPMASSPVRALTPHSDASDCSIPGPGPHPPSLCQLKVISRNKIKIVMNPSPALIQYCWFIVILAAVTFLCYPCLCNVLFVLLPTTV